MMIAFDFTDLFSIINRCSAKHINIVGNLYIYICDNFFESYCERQRYRSNDDDNDYSDDDNHYIDDDNDYSDDNNDGSAFKLRC